MYVGALYGNCKPWTTEVKCARSRSDKHSRHDLFRKYVILFPFGKSFAPIDRRLLGYELCKLEKGWMNQILLSFFEHEQNKSLHAKGQMKDDKNHSLLHKNYI